MTDPSSASFVERVLGERILEPFEYDSQFDLLNAQRPESESKGRHVYVTYGHKHGPTHHAEPLYAGPPLTEELSQGQGEHTIKSSERTDTQELELYDADESSAIEALADENTPKHHYDTKRSLRSHARAAVPSHFAEDMKPSHVIKHPTPAVHLGSEPSKSSADESQSIAVTPHSRQRQKQRKHKVLESRSRSSSSHRKMAARKATMSAVPSNSHQHRKETEKKQKQQKKKSQVAQPVASRTRSAVKYISNSESSE